MCTSLVFLIQARCNSPHLVLLATMLIFVLCHSSLTVSSRLLCAPIISVLVLVFVLAPLPLPCMDVQTLASVVHPPHPPFLANQLILCVSKPLCPRFSFFCFRFIQQGD